jgi:hypothetical protein
LGDQKKTLCIVKNPISIAKVAIEKVKVKTGIEKEASVKAKEGME